jgi:hypothetical protein
LVRPQSTPYHPSILAFMFFVLLSMYAFYSLLLSLINLLQGFFHQLTRWLTFRFISHTMDENYS